MVRTLTPGMAETCRGTVICADALNRPALWQA